MRYPTLLLVVFIPVAAYSQEPGGFLNKVQPSENYTDLLLSVGTGVYDIGSIDGGYYQSRGQQVTYGLAARRLVDYDARTWIQPGISFTAEEFELEPNAPAVGAGIPAKPEKDLQVIDAGLAAGYNFISLPGLKCYASGGFYGSAIVKGQDEQKTFTGPITRPPVTPTPPFTTNNPNNATQNYHHFQPGFIATLGGGVNYYPNHRIGIDLQCNWRSYFHDIETDVENDLNRFNVSLGIAIRPDKKEAVVKGVPFHRLTPEEQRQLIREWERKW